MSRKRWERRIQGWKRRHRLHSGIRRRNRSVKRGERMRALRGSLRDIRLPAVVVTTLGLGPWGLRESGVLDMDPETTARMTWMAVNGGLSTLTAAGRMGLAPAALLGTAATGVAATAVEHDGGNLGDMVDVAKWSAGAGSVAYFWTALRGSARHTMGAPGRVWRRSVARLFNGADRAGYGAEVIGSGISHGVSLAGSTVSQGVNVASSSVSRRLNATGDRLSQAGSAVVDVLRPPKKKHSLWKLQPDAFLSRSRRHA